MSSGDPFQQAGTLSQQGTTDFLNTASSITVSNQLATFGDGLLNAGSSLPAVSQNSAVGNSAAGNIVLSGPIVATGSTTNVLISSGNLSLNLEFDAAAVSAGSGFMSDIEQAASILVDDLHVNNAITVNLGIQFGGTGVASTGAEGGASGGSAFSYTEVRQALLANAPGDANLNALPAGDSVTGFNGSTTVSYSTVDVWSAEEKALGLLAGDNSTLDGTVDFGTNIGSTDLVGVALHELTHAMGRVPDGTATPDVFDLFRFYTQGTILASDASSSSAPPAYFSVDGGNSPIVAYGTASDPSDFMDSSAPNDPFDEVYGTTTAQTLTALDLQQMDVLGFGTACFAAGTALATPNGAVPVEALREGMALLTVSGAIRPVRWIGRRSLDLSRHPQSEEVCPIRIRAGALGQGVPLRDLRVSPEHALFLDGGLVPARLLVNERSIVRETGCRHVVWYHVELDSHELVLAEGAATETYLDTGNRGLFQNAAGPLVLHPDFAAGQAERVARSCAPLLDDPARVEPIWRKLAERAASAGFGAWEPVATTPDPDIALGMGGRLSRPVAAGDGRYVFVLPAVTGPVRLISRASAPGMLWPWVADRRRLGVCVSLVSIRDGAGSRVVAADDPALSEGWFAAECEAAGPRRWTGGDAVLPLEPGGPVVVEVACRTLAGYALAAAGGGRPRQVA